MAMSEYLLNGTFSANGQSATFEASPATRHRLSRYFLSAVTFGAGTLNVQVSPDGGTTWINYPNAALSSASGGANALTNHLELMGDLFRLDLSGATAPDIDYHFVLRPVESAPVETHTLTADGQTATFYRPHGKHRKFVVAAYGTWGGGTLTLQYSVDGGTNWLNDADAVFTGNGMAEVTASEAGADMDGNMRDVHRMFRWSLSGATSPSLTMRTYW